MAGFDFRFQIRPEPCRVQRSGSRIEMPAGVGRDQPAARAGSSRFVKNHPNSISTRIAFLCVP